MKIRATTITACTLGAILLSVALGWGHDPRARTPLRVPDILGFRTLKCDFHTHTVFSDGSVWPDVRAEEAWREGLDAVAITDHIEYLPHKEDLGARHDRSFEIARPMGEALRLTVIKGSEITRDMPPGHLNAIFLEDSSAVDTGDDWRAAVREAHRQKAFIFWNHPGWSGQQPDGVARWYPEHTELVQAGMLHGIEVVNSREYYPEAHRWCLEHKLTMLSNSDVHAPLNLEYDVVLGDRRPVTLVFARDASPEAIREALFAGRTAAWSGSMLVGEEQFLKPIFRESIVVVNPTVELRGRRQAYIQIENRSDLDYELVAGSGPSELRIPASLVLRAGRTVLLSLRAVSVPEGATGTVWERDVTLQYRVDNLKIAPDVGMPVEFSFHVKAVAD
ncbi:MAG: Sb-PDE family phosphodiesterase [Acidobacteriota bacterium]